MKKLLISAVAGAGMLGVGAASAAVTNGTLTQIYQNATTTYVYVSPGYSFAVPGYVHYCLTTDPDLAAAAVANVNHNVYIGCAAATWPATGSYRYGGTLSFIYAQ